jgi:transcriptional regulator with XRE-family HTH domain
MGSTMGRPRNDTTTPLSEWLDRNQDKVSRDAFAEKLGIARQHVDRLARGGGREERRRPGLDLAFDIENATAEISGGKDVVKASGWCLPRGQRRESSKTPPHKRRVTTR